MGARLPLHAGVAPDVPASKAGVNAGDIIVNLAGEPIKNLYDDTFLIGDLKVGEEAAITVQCGSERISLKITPRIAVVSKMTSETGRDKAPAFATLSTADSRHKKPTRRIAPGRFGESVSRK